MGVEQRRRALRKAKLVHPDPGSVTAPLFDGTRAFFLAEDKAQVKYEMLRAHYVDGVAVRAAAEAHGYSRAAFYLIAAAFEGGWMRRLFDERRGRKGPSKVTPEIAGFVAEADEELSDAEVARRIENRYGVKIHPCTVWRTRHR